LLVVAVILLLLISTWVSLSQGQLMHARRLMADYGKLQAIYAAEAGVYARLAASSDLDASLVDTPQSQIGYVAVQKVYPDGTWIESTGSARVQDHPYQATARAQVLLGRIMKWDLRGS
jgi:hypothetical protein